jgi:hypothetical protein
MQADAVLPAAARQPLKVLVAALLHDMTLASHAAVALA